MENKKCKICGDIDVIKNTRFCRKHYNDKKRAYARTHKRNRYIYKSCCEICKKDFMGTNKIVKFCKDCRKKVMFGDSIKILNNYENAKGKGYCWMHRRIAEEILKRKLASNEVVHHLDENTRNNKLENLIIISRCNHAKLHLYLRKTRAILEKSNNMNSEDCWKTLIVPITTAWLETAGANVIKIWEIGQSAGESLQENFEGKASETMHGIPETSSVVGKDIVQTTTLF